jgi:hypothetical protein
VNAFGEWGSGSLHERPQPGASPPVDATAGGEGMPKKDWRHRGGFRGSGHQLVLARTGSGNTVDTKASSTSSHDALAELVAYEGHMRKRGRYNKAFKTRFFVLYRGIMRYYSSRWLAAS